jgi:DNA-directed RNA polymerase subunit RPC12/RpoP
MKLYEEFKLYETLWENCKSMPFTAEELEAALVKVTWGVFVGRDDSDSDIMVVGDEPYSSTEYEASKENDGTYALSTWLSNADGGGREGDTEEFNSLEELYQRICELKLDDMPSAKELLEAKVSTIKDKQALTEARSIADIEAEIAGLQQELAQAKEDEKRAASKGTKSVWIWDMYIDAADKGSWTSIDQGVVFETKDKAIEEGSYHLGELDDEGELLDDDENPVDPDEYTVDAIEIPLIRVPEDILRYSRLGHLWDPTTTYDKVGKCSNCLNMLRYNSSELPAGFTCPYCGTKLKGRSK